MSEESSCEAFEWKKEILFQIREDQEDDLMEQDLDSDWNVKLSKLDAKIPVPFNNF